MFDALLCRNWPLSPPKSRNFTDNSIVSSLNQSCNPGINSYCSWRALLHDWTYNTCDFTWHLNDGLGFLHLAYLVPKIFASPKFTCDLFVLGKGWEELDWVMNILFWIFFFTKWGKFFHPKNRYLTGFNVSNNVPLKFPSYVPNVFPMCSPCIPLIFINVLSIAP